MSHFLKDLRELAAFSFGTDAGGWGLRTAGLTVQTSRRRITRGILQLPFPKSQAMSPANVCASHKHPTPFPENSSDGYSVCTFLK